ncbi:uncharacterized protein LOC141729298 [Zonotrichia albicollis]|uniref:uncharacterized protein LOC141729298 n=1 Tax=Zonotrichia albicollis TaxID=44394 RepID=UPI003D80CA93
MKPMSNTQGRGDRRNSGLHVTSSSSVHSSLQQPHLHSLINTTINEGSSGDFGQDRHPCKVKHRRKHSQDQGLRACPWKALLIPNGAEAQLSALGCHFQTGSPQLEHVLPQPPAPPPPAPPGRRWSYLDAPGREAGDGGRRRRPWRSAADAWRRRRPECGSRRARSLPRRRRSPVGLGLGGGGSAASPAQGGVGGGFRRGRLRSVPCTPRCLRCCCLFTFPEKGPARREGAEPSRGGAAGAGGGSAGQGGEALLFRRRLARGRASGGSRWASGSRSYCGSQRAPAMALARTHSLSLTTERAAATAPRPRTAPDRPPEPPPGRAASVAPGAALAAGSAGKGPPPPPAARPRSPARPSPLSPFSPSRRSHPCAGRAAGPVGWAVKPGAAEGRPRSG